MAVNTFSQGNKSVAVPLKPTAATASTSATTTDVTVSWTPNSQGVPATEYTVVGTATGAVTTSKTTKENSTLVPSNAPS